VPEPTNARLEQFSLLVLVCVAVAAFGTAYDQPPIWGFWLPCVVSMFWRIQRVPTWLEPGARISAHIFEALALVLGLIFMAYPVLSAETAARLTLLAGYGLSLFASLFLLGTPVWRRATTLFPATLALLVVDCFNPEAKHRPLLVGAAVAVFAYLSLPAVGRGFRKVSAAQWIRLANFALVAALVAATAVVVVPRLQSQMENMEFQFFQTNLTAYSGLSDVTHLGDLEELKLSPRVVMRLWTDHPQDLRARTYPRFDGHGWQAAPSISSPLQTMALDGLPASQLHDWLEQIPGSTYIIHGQDLRRISSSCVRTRIIQSLFNNGMMVSPGNKLLVRVALPNLRVDSQENLQPPPAGGVEIYGTLNCREGDMVQRTAASPQELRQALEVPENTDPRIYRLAARLAEHTSSPEEKLRRTASYLQHEYHYELRVGKFHTAQPVAEFLFEKKKGYCQYFASAGAVLLRLEGVPTRYVSGFHVTENNRSGDHYVVRELDAHAWIESYIPGKGWVQADPTPAAEYDSLHAGLSRGWLANTLEWGRAKIAEFLVHFRGEEWSAGLRWLWMQMREFFRWFSLTWSGVLAVMLLAWLLHYVWWRGKLVQRDHAAVNAQLEPIESAPELAQLLKRVDLYWTKCGLMRPAHRTPLEHLEAISAEKASPGMRRASRQLIETYYRASFGGASVPTEEELRAILHELSCFEREGASAKTLKARFRLRNARVTQAVLGSYRAAADRDGIERPSSKID